MYSYKKFLHIGYEGRSIPMLSIVRSQITEKMACSYVVCTLQNSCIDITNHVNKYLCKAQ